jgi:uncharacterized protein (TIGR02646 family)
MIKLDLPEKPDKLTKELQAALTEKFKKTRKSVWNIEWLKVAVFNKSFGKCCYSEIGLGEESKYMEIDHFAPKTHYPDLVMEWSNLLPSCKKCNGSKGSHDTVNNRIIYPFNDNPKDFLYFKGYRYYGKDIESIGKKTIDVLDLNNNKEFVSCRYRVADEIKEILEDLYDAKGVIFDSDRKRTKYIHKIKNLMKRGERKAPYAALVSTTLLEDDNYKRIESFLSDNILWDEELERLKKELEFCSLPNP